MAAPNQTKTDINLRKYVTSKNHVSTTANDSDDYSDLKSNKPHVFSSSDEESSPPTSDKDDSIDIIPRIYQDNSPNSSLQLVDISDSCIDSMPSPPTSNKDDSLSSSEIYQLYEFTPNNSLQPVDIGDSCIVSMPSLSNAPSTNENTSNDTSQTNKPASIIRPAKFTYPSSKRQKNSS